MKRTVPSKCSWFDRGWLEFPSAAMTLVYKMCIIMWFTGWKCSSVQVVRNAFSSL